MVKRKSGNGYVYNHIQDYIECHGCGIIVKGDLTTEDIEKLGSHPQNVILYCDQCEEP